MPAGTPASPRRTAPPADLPFFWPLVQRLRGLGVPVGTSETLDLARALSAGVHEHSVTGFYYLARALLIHHEGHLDAFDRAFLAEYRGLEAELATGEQLRDWLDDAREALAELGRSDAELLQSLDLAELRRLFEQRKAEQTERHDGGSHWIGTRGTSPFGEFGRAGGGISTGSSGGGRAALRTADARQYAGYRSDVVIDVRQLEVALRRLRAFVRAGAPTELDLAATVDATARNAGDIEVVTRPPHRPDLHVIVMTDVGGSMFPYTRLMSRLFTATQRATHFKELRSYSFHNAVYGRVFATEQFSDPVWVPDLMRQCGPQYRLIMVGDAYMAPYELQQRGMGSVDDRSGLTGLEWLRAIRRHWPDSVWLNPEPTSRWPGSTIETIGSVFDMYPLTIDGVTEAMRRLNRHSR